MSKKNLQTQVKSALLTGILVLAPIGLTVWVFIELFTFVDRFRKILPAHWQPEEWLGFHIPGLGVLLSLIIVALVGSAMKYYAGRPLVEFSELVLEKVPLVSSVYQGLKQLMQTLFSNKGTQFREVVVVEYPRKGIYCFAFLTNSDSYIRDDEELISIFLPTTPNPTSGFFLLVPISQLKSVDLSVEEAFKLIMSAGLVAPEIPRTLTPYGTSVGVDVDDSMGDKLSHEGKIPQLAKEQ